MEKENHTVVKGIINNLNPILTKIDKNSIVILIREFEEKDKIKKKNFLWAYVSLIKLAREKSLIKFSEEQFYIEEIMIPKERIEVYIYFKKINVFKGFILFNLRVYYSILIDIFVWKLFNS